LKTIEVTDHFGAFNRSVLVGERAYPAYFDHVKFALNSLMSSLPKIKSDNPYEIEVLNSFSEKFLYSITLFEQKFSYSEDHPMLVDVTKSGFPNHLEFKRLEDDLLKRDQVLKNLPSRAEVKNLILDDLMKNHTDPTARLKKLGEICYYEELLKHKVFREFTPGKLQLIKSFGDTRQTRRFMYSWGSYDSVTNRPYVYIMIFDNPSVDDELIMQGQENTDFEAVIKKATHNTSPLKVIAADIDAAYESIRPKVLKRIDFGPIFSRFARDEHEFTKLVQEQFEEDDFIFVYNTEVVFSVGEKKHSGFLSSGDLRQVFFVDESNKECLDRMVSQVFSYAITSHRVLQHLNVHHPAFIQSLSVPPTIFEK
jgi:hypothetical protein